MKIRLHTFNMGRTYETELEINRAGFCDGPCRRLAVRVLQFDNSQDEYPSIQLCADCLALAAAELLAQPSPKT